jgi:hypothetical protein
MRLSGDTSDTSSLTPLANALTESAPRLADAAGAGAAGLACACCSLFDSRPCACAIAVTCATEW